MPGECFVRFTEIGTDAEDSAVDAGLGFAVKERAVVERLEDEALVDAVEHAARLPAGGVETEVFEECETVKGNKVPLWPAAPVAGGKLGGEKLGAPALGGDARALGGDCVGGGIGEVAHDLPADGGVRIEQPF